MLKSIYTIFILLIVQPSYCQDLDKHAWIESGYQKCLTDSLPCDCYSFNPPNFIYYNPLNTHLFEMRLPYAIVNYSNSDTITFNLINRTSYIKGETDSLHGSVTIIKDSMYIQTNDRVFNYINVEKSINYEDAICLNYLNTLLVENGYKDLHSTLKSDSLSCNCDIQFGISRVHNTKKIWIFERKNDILYMYQWKYPKEIELKSKKKLKRKFKLKK